MLYRYLKWTEVFRVNLCFEVISRAEKIWKENTKLSLTTMLRVSRESRVLDSALENIDEILIESVIMSKSIIISFFIPELFHLLHASRAARSNNVQSFHYQRHSGHQYYLPCTLQWRQWWRTCPVEAKAFSHFPNGIVVFSRRLYDGRWWVGFKRIWN